jgi:hypothetical protein
VNANMFRTMLLELDPIEAAENSILNHHVEGLDYLCLHRSLKLTVKLYLIDPERIAADPCEFLVTPHTHRYAFESTVLSGSLVHDLFEESEGQTYARSIYEPETKTRIANGACDLRSKSAFTHLRASSYWVGIDDIHTLHVPAEPVLLGLVQFADTARTSTVYVRYGSEMKYPESRKPTSLEVIALRNRAFQMMSKS